MLLLWVPALVFLALALTTSTGRASAPAPAPPASQFAGKAGEIWQFRFVVADTSQIQSTAATIAATVAWAIYGEQLPGYVSGNSVTVVMRLSQDQTFRLTPGETFDTPQGIRVRFEGATRAPAGDSGSGSMQEATIAPPGWVEIPKAQVPGGLQFAAVSLFHPGDPPTKVAQFSYQGGQYAAYTKRDPSGVLYVAVLRKV